MLDDKDIFTSYEAWIEAGYSNYDGANNKGPHTGKYNQWHQCHACFLVDPDPWILPPEASRTEQAKREAARAPYFR